MKKISYQFNAGTDEAPILIDKEIRFPNTAYESTLAIAAQEAYNSEYIVEEDEETIPTEQEDTAAMLIDHEYRLTLLELGITE